MTANLSISKGVFLVIALAFQALPSPAWATEDTACIECLTQKAAFHGTLIAGYGDHLIYHNTHTREGVPGEAPQLETPYNIGSMGKMFAATAVGQLVDHGKVAFSDRIKTYLPDLPSSYDNIKIEHLLSHTAGLGNYLTPANMERIRAHQKLSDLLPLVLADDVQFEPGSEMQYSNSGYIILGLLIEAISGQSYYDYIRENIFDAANMTGSSFDPSPTTAQNFTQMSMRPPSSDDQSARQAPAVAPAYHSSPMNGGKGMPAGGSYSTVQDLYRFGNALIDGTLVSPQTLAMLTQPYPNAVLQSRSGNMVAYGFGFQIAENGQRIGHGGGGPGVNGELRIWLDSGLVVAGLTNLDPPLASQMVSTVGGALSKQ